MWLSGFLFCGLSMRPKHVRKERLGLEGVWRVVMTISRGALRGVRLAERRFLQGQESSW